MKRSSSPHSPGIKKTKLLNPAGASVLEIWKSRKEKVGSIISAAKRLLHATYLLVRPCVRHDNLLIELRLQKYFFIHITELMPTSRWWYLQMRLKPTLCLLQEASMMHKEFQGRKSLDGITQLYLKIEKQEKMNWKQASSSAIQETSEIWLTCKRH